MIKYLLIVALVSFGCRESKERTIHFPQLGWTLPIAANWQFVDSSFDKKGYIVDSLWKTRMIFKEEKSIKLFDIHVDSSARFNCVIFIDSSDIEGWKTKAIDDAHFYRPMIKDAPPFELRDTANRIEKIGGEDLFLVYNKLYNKLKSKTDYDYQFHRKMGHYTMFINIRFTDERKGEELLNVFRQSTFKKP